MHSSLKVEKIESFSEFEGLRNFWNKILQKSMDNDIFSTWDWLWCWWKHFGSGRKLRILIVKEGNQVIGIAPFMLSNYNFLRFSKLSKIEFMSSPHGDYNNFILLRREAECVRLLLDALMEFSDWNMLDLRDIREESASAKTLISISSSKNGNLKLKVKVKTLCPYIRLPSRIETFERRLSRNVRRNLRKRMRKLSRMYKVEFTNQKEFNSVSEAMTAFFRLHQKRWRAKGELGAFASENFRKFHLDLAKIFDEKGWLALHFLMLDGEPVAAAYTFNYNSKKYGYLTGFDPDFKQFGVGNLLKMHIIEECIRKGYKEYDLTRDFEPYKADWATNIRKNYAASLVRKGLFARIYSRFVRSKISSLLYDKLGLQLSVQSV
ncbi:hypothetical protein DRO54_09820 [Candidatus Bathyarchaeota archaeon]|nr:MAG: hypothetical protein DRO54_09820 [Candidatus Bathyarchaeota archaeon]